MGIDVIQSQNLMTLLAAAIHTSAPPVHSAFDVFRKKYYVVPNHGVGQWLQQSIAAVRTISANTEFVQLRTFQWQMYQSILGTEVVAKAPQLLNMKWRIFLFLSPFLQQSLSEQHPLFSIMAHIHQHSQSIGNRAQRDIKQQQMLYWVADHTSRIFSNYIIYRGQCLNGCVKSCHCRQNWLARWAEQQPINVEKYVRRPEKDVMQSQPQLVQHAIERAKQLEAWQRFIWSEEFAQDFAAINAIDQQFWQRLDEQPELIARLPQQIQLFTLLELPPSQLYFLRRLAQYVSVKVFHYTPSQEYWADSVDPKWRARYALKFPDAAVYYESRHPLLTRLGKQARDISALLSQLSGGEEGLWDDIFPDPEEFESENANQNLLQKLQSDILHLREPKAASFLLRPDDLSLQIHVCHSTIRQLEVLKIQLIDWLNDQTHSVSGQSRQLSDIVVLVPNLQEIEPMIRTVFSPNYASEKTQLPIKIAGVPLLDAVQLWQALSLRIQLLQGRFTLDQLIDWLSMPPIQQIYQLDFADIQRITTLLQLAGFRRGFDDAHLRQSLDSHDQDLRFSFRYALNRLSLSIAMPEHAVFHDVLGMTQVRHDDFALIAVLLQIYQDLDHRRTWLEPLSIEQQPDIEHSLDILHQDVQQFAEVTGFTQVQDAITKLKRIIRVTINDADHADIAAKQTLRLPMQYMLDEISNSIDHQIAQTEPTGQITFAQIGQLRPLPYQLTVCLNLDVGTFPNRDNHIPYDLMELLTAEVGDRSRLDDDQGAFLDAILQAQQSVWLFYNGFDVNDHQPRDPSSILQELIAHLELIVTTDHKLFAANATIQSDFIADDQISQDQRQQTLTKKINLNGIEVAEQLTTLYQVHPLQPFDAASFYTPDVEAHTVAKIPVRFHDQWFEVAQQLQRPHSQAFQWLDQDYPSSSQQQNQTEPTPLQILESRQWIRELSQPAQHFLQHVGIKSVDELTQLDSYEPLMLDALAQHGIQHYLQQDLQQQNPESLFVRQEKQLLQDRLPIGQMQNATLEMAMHDFDQVHARLNQYGGKITELTQQRWQYDAQTLFLYFLPTATSDQSLAQNWVSLSASSCRGERALSVWLEYLLWRASHSADDHGQRIALFKNCTLIIEGLTQAKAYQLLTPWLQAWSAAQQKPFVLPPSLFADVVNKPLKWQFDDQHLPYIENYKDIESTWLGKNFDQNSPIKNDQNKGCYLYRDWQLLLVEQDHAALLNQFTQKYAAALYQPMAEHIRIED